jgi:glucose-6-phosphate isomerase
MDQHFSTADFDQNMPVLMALISVWYNNFYNAESECIVPYSQYLNKFVAYLQQGIMESNGKYVDRNGAVVNYQTGTIVWGSTGTNAQHAFFQLIHQGTKLIPADFIAFKECLFEEQDHQNKLLANCVAQTQALMSGTQGQEIESPYREFAGNKPTNTLLIDRLTPNRLGGLIALYEHKLFVQGVIWNIFSYDQWGVELGKKLAVNVLRDIESSDNLAEDSVDNSGKFDASTAELLRRIKA